MRLPLALVGVLLLAGCTAPGPSASEAPQGPTAWSESGGSVGALLVPRVQDARLSYPAGNYSSGQIKAELSGTATSVELDAPDPCEGHVAARGPAGGSVTIMWDCGPMRLEGGKLVLRASGGVAWGTLSLKLVRIHN